MPGKRLCLPLALALLAVPALSGCASSEPSAAIAVAHMGLLGPIGEQLKREDDEQEARELAQQAPPTDVEREQARERAAASEVEAAQAQQQREQEEG